LDEPLGQLDAKVRNELRYDIKRMVRDLGLTAIHVTHDQSEAMAISDRIAVMKKGKVLQVGTPEELYMKPESVFVAHFIGESNFLEGYVSSKSVEGAIVELRGEAKVQTVDKSAKIGERVILAVRPETFIVEKGVKSSENSFLGTIERVTFEGTNMRYEIRLENQDLIVIIKPSLTEEWLNTGEKVNVSFPPERSHVFAYPKAGLREEIAVE
jgi:ABC-type Fe3+/spermidine/putrescine transport system ATPase subunit